MEIKNFLQFTIKVIDAFGLTVRIRNDSSLKIYIQILFWKKILGTLNLFNWGRVEHGYWNGAYVSEVGYFPNPKPNACYSKTGLTFLKSIYLTINFEKSKGKSFSCSGYSTNTNSPGLVIK
jgi:hypothetical protein